MLRTLGIRHVLAKPDFSGSGHNTIQRFVDDPRFRTAHTWVEAWVPEAGGQTLTPRLAIEADEGRLAIQACTYLGWERHLAPVGSGIRGAGAAGGSLADQ